MNFTQPIRDLKQVAALSNYYRNNPRNHALIVLGVHTALRIGDLLSLTWGNVYDFAADEICRCVDLHEQKTGKHKTLALHANAVKALRRLLDSLPTAPAADTPVFASRKGNKAIGRSQAWRIISEAAEAVNIESGASCDSLRKTIGYHAWKSSQSIAVIMEVYNHSSFAAMRRYLGVTRDELDTAAQAAKNEKAVL